MSQLWFFGSIAFSFIAWGIVTARYIWPELRLRQRAEALRPVLKKLRLRDMSETAFVWFPRRQSPAYYDRLMHECFRGGLKAPNIVQEAVDQATMLSLVTCRIGVAFVSDATRWRCPAGVVLLPVLDLNLPLPFALIWRKDNTSPVLEKFVADVHFLPEVRALKTPQSV